MAWVKSSNESLGSGGATVSLRNLTKRYGQSVAVDNINLDIKAGEFVTLLGPSGSGKTTTLGMVAGFTDVTSGQILLGGQPIEELPPYRRNIGMVFQSYTLFPHMTVFDNVAFPLKRRGVSRSEIKQKVGRVLDLIQLGDKSGRYPRELSGGQQQRVAIARAIVFEPRLLLMDEPLGALDKKLREHLQLEIKRLHEELKITFVFVTHDQEEALIMSDRIAVFQDGHVAQIGTAEQLYESPKSLFVADFLGDSNIFHGTAKTMGTGHQLQGPCWTFNAPRNAELAEAAAAAITVRPERMRILPDGVVPADGHNHVNGTVTEIIYIGSSRKVGVALPDGSRIHVREQSGDQSQVHGGANVKVCWPVACTTILSASRDFTAAA